MAETEIRFRPVAAFIKRMQNVKLIYFMPRFIEMCSDARTHTCEMHRLHFSQWDFCRIHTQVVLNDVAATHVTAHTARIRASSRLLGGARIIYRAILWSCAISSKKASKFSLPAEQEKSNGCGTVKKTQLYV